MLKFIKRMLMSQVTWAGWQFVVLRAALISLGVLLGALLADHLMPYLWLIGVLCVLTLVWAGIMYFKAMHKPPETIS